MPSIGQVTKHTDGSYSGHLATLSIRAKIRILPVASAPGEVRPDYRVLAGDVEIGGGWIRTGGVDGDTVSLSLAAPEFGPRRLYAHLGRIAGAGDPRFSLIWIPVD